MTHASSQLNPFSRSLEELFSASSTLPVRCKAFNRLQQVGLPTRRHEAFTYLPLSSLFSKEIVAAEKSATITAADIDPFIYPECKDSCLVFVGGHYSKELSRLENTSSGIFVMPYSAALSGSYRSFLQKKEQDRLAVENDPFALINLSLAEDGIFIYASPGARAENVLQLLFVDGGEKALSLPKVHIALGANASMNIISRYAHLQSSSYSVQNPYIEVSLDDSASFEHTLVASGLKSSATDFFALRATLKKKASLSCFNLASGSSLSRQDYHVVLVGEEADARLHGLSWLDRSHHSHVHILMDHAAPSCTSDQFFKTVLSDVSQASFTGKILVRQIAQKTMSYQLNNNLLLSEGAIANSKPGLEILADDVKASHGATFCQLDDDELFYLRSRGLSETLARSLLLKGFCKEMVDKITLPSLQKELMAQIDTIASISRNYETI